MEERSRFCINFMAAFCMMLASCSGDDKLENVSPTPEQPAELTVVVPKSRADIVITAEESKVNDAANQFSLSFFEQVMKQQDASSNIVISPFSAQVALAMAANGAQGGTLDEMLTALNMKGSSLDDINKYNQTIIKAITDIDNTTFTTSANGIWSKLNLLDAFSSRVQKVYDARVETTDFSPKAIASINDWTNEQTHGIIPRLFDEDEKVSNDVMLILANTLYFYGVWAEPFSPGLTVKNVFTSADKSVSSIDMMKEGGDKNYLSCKTFDLCEKPYGNEAFSMVFLLPHQDVTLNACINDLAQMDWKGLTTSLSNNYKLVRLTVPKFELKEMKYDLIAPLKGMGIQKAFTQQADFRNMTDETDLFISRVDQKTAITLHEQGTQAAAVTKVEKPSTAYKPPQPIEFTLDRPFAFLIKEKSTGVILFAGAINKL